MAALRSVNSFIDLFKEVMRPTGPSSTSGPPQAVVAASAAGASRFGPGARAGAKAEDVDPLLLALAERWAKSILNFCR